MLKFLFFKLLSVQVEIARKDEDIEVPLYTEGETLKQYAGSLKEFVENFPEIRGKIEKMRKEKKLLPIPWRFRV